MDKKKIFKYIEKIQETLEKIENFQRKHTDEKILVAFRGEPRDYKKTKLMPSIFRSSETLNKESYLFELMSDYGTGKKWCGCGPYGSRNHREDSILRSMLWCRRYTCQQRILHPPLNQKLPEP